MEIRVNATRMQLLRTRKRLAMAVRGHKLLKDKRDELMKKFMELIKKAKALRDDVEHELSLASRSFVMAQMNMSREAAEEALMSQSTSVELSVKLVPIMSVRVPDFRWQSSPDAAGVEAYPYGLVTTASDLDQASSILS
ncbi:MAG TPA: V-type ATP synthase subunit D, partial [Firmicutes bacterium]|nr:V-type ATP synthase subunit D [Bacillota bacterium]